MLRVVAAGPVTLVGGRNARACALTQMEDDDVIVVAGLAGTITGAVVGKAIFSLPAEAVILSAFVFGVMGALTGCTFVATRRARSGRSPLDAPHPTETPRQTSKTFRKRLAQFTGRDESEVMVESQAYQSKMPFWMAVDVLVRIPPKSVQLIRHYLVSIRNAVRGK